MIRETTMEAYRKILPHIGRYHGLILDALMDYPEGLTQQQILAEMKSRFSWCRNTSGSTIRPRCGELVDAGLLADTGRISLNEKENKCIVWARVIDFPLITERIKQRPSWKIVLLEQMDELRAENEKLKGALRWALGKGRQHYTGCVCVECVNARKALNGGEAK